MKKIISRSRYLRKNHLTIIVQADNEKEADYTVNKLKMAIQKMNRRMENEVSFEIFRNVRPYFVKQ